MRVRTLLLPLVAALALGSAVPTWAHHDCGNEKSQDEKEREACEKEQERRERDRDGDGKDDKDDKEDRDGERGRNGKGRGSRSPAPPPPPPREQWAETDTARTELRFSVSAEVVADWVPNRYQVSLAGGRATVFVTARSFTSPGGPAVLHEASVALSAPDGSAGVHSYLLWQVTDAKWLADKLVRVGLPVHQLSAPYTSTSAGLLAQVQADVALGDVDYSFTGTVRESAGASTGTPNVIWYDGFLGTVRASTACTACGTPGDGLVHVSANADSRVGAYLSGEISLTPASFVRSSGTTVALVVA